MAARALVESDIDLGDRMLNALDEAEIPIEVAYWMLSPEWSDWWLVLGTSLEDQPSTPSAQQQVVDVRRSLENTDYLMGKLGVVGMHHQWVRALRQRLSHGLPHPGYRLGPFFAADLEVEDSYVYRMQPGSTKARNGTRMKSQSAANTASTSLKTAVVERLKSEVRTTLGVGNATTENSSRSSG